MNTKWQKIKIIVISVLLIAIYILINVLCATNALTNETTKISGETYLSREDYNFSKMLKKASSYLEQPFTPQNANLEYIKIRLLTDIDKTSEDLVLRFTLLDGEQVIHSEDVNLTELEFYGWEYYDFAIPNKLKKGKQYSLRMEQIGGSFKEDKPSIYTSPSRTILAYQHVKENEEYYIYNGKKQDGEWEVSYVYRVYKYQYTDATIVQVALNIVFLILVGIIIYGAYRNRRSEKFSKRLAIGMYVSVPVLTYVLVETITGNLTKVTAMYCLKNLAIYYVIFIVLSLVLHKIGTLTVTYSTMFILIAMVQYYVTLFRGRPFMLQDLTAVNTAATVANSYKYYISVQVLACLLVYMLLAVLACVTLYRFMNKKYLMVMVPCLIVICGTAIYMNGKGKLFDSINTWAIEENYQNMGLINTLISEIPYLKVEKPEGYSVQAVKEIVSDVTEVSESENTPHNIIVIMNETFSDLERFNEIATDSELLPFVKSMQEDTIKGYLHVPVFGAGTSNSEYEVLTGNSVQFLVQGSTPYQMNVKEKEYGLATTLKEQGYTSIALHPYLGVNWNRNNVYVDMEFDEFYSEENWESDIDYIHGCASDKSAYDKVIELDEQSDEKMFMFLVTMQNHGGYTVDGYESTVSLQYEQDYPQAEQYLSLLQESDKAFQELIEYYQKQDEKTLIIMFGDHQASIEEDFYGEVFGKSIEDLSFEEVQQRYVTPFYIWANYDIEEATDIEMSSNYFGSYILDVAGVEMSDYNEFLLELQQEIPIIGQGGICDNAGNWYDFDHMPEQYTKRINEYKILQYNYVFDWNHRVDEIFTVK